MIDLPLIIGISPFECPDSGLAASLARAGALGVLDLGHDPDAARLALDALATRSRRPFGVRCHDHTTYGIELPEFAQVVVVPASARAYHCAALKRYAIRSARSCASAMPA